MGSHTKGMLLKTMVSHTKRDPFKDNGFPYKGMLFKTMASHTKGGPFKDNGFPYKGGSS